MTINFRVCLSLFIYTPCLIIQFASCATWPVLFNLLRLGKIYKKLQLNQRVYANTSVIHPIRTFIGYLVV